MVDQVERIAEVIADNSAAAPQVTVREFLNWYAAKRRVENVVSRIRADLAANNLKTKPDFESAWIDSKITFEAQAQDDADVSSSQVESEALNVEGYSNSPEELSDIVDVVQWVASDPTHQLSKLKAANQVVQYVSPNDLISVAVTKMLLHDYSQLPVMTNERTVKGVISWKSIGAHMVLGRDGKEVRHAMSAAKDLPVNASIFEAIGVVSKHDYVLVKDATQKITGIVTATDLTEQFRSLSEPFLLLSEIENHLRNMMAERFEVLDFEKVRDTTDLRPISTVADLTFGEYVRLLESQENWVRFGLNLDRAYFCGRLEVVRRTRNEVMHFDPDGIEPEQLLALEEFVSALRTIQGK